MQTTVIVSALAPTVASSARLSPAPVSTIVRGTALRTITLHPSTIEPGTGNRFRISTPARMATMAELMGRRTPDALAT